MKREEYVFGQSLDISPLFSTLERIIQVVVFKLKKNEDNWKLKAVKCYYHLSLGSTKCLDNFAFRSS